MNYQRVTIALAGAVMAAVVPAGIASADPGENITPTGPESTPTPDGGLTGLDSQTLGFQDFSVIGNSSETFEGAVRSATDVFGGTNYNVDVYADPTGGLTDGEQYNYFVIDGFGEEYDSIGVTPEAEYITPFGDFSVPTAFVEALGANFFEPSLEEATEPAAAADLPSLLDIGAFLP